MEKSNFYKELSNVPPIPDEIFDDIIKNSKVKLTYFIPKAAVALFIFAVTLGLYFQNDDKTENILLNQDESIAYIYETYSDNYDLLEDL